MKLRNIRTEYQSVSPSIHFINAGILTLLTSMLCLKGGCSSMRSRLLKCVDMVLMAEMLAMQFRDNLKNSFGLSCSSMESRLESEK